MGSICGRACLLPHLIQGPAMLISMNCIKWQKKQSRRGVSASCQKHCSYGTSGHHTWKDRACFCTKTGELSTGHQAASVTGSQMLWQIASFDVHTDTFIHPCQALHLVIPKRQAMCNVATLVSLLGAVPSLPPAARLGELGMGSVSSSAPTTAVIPPVPPFIHTSSCTCNYPIIPSCCLVGIAPSEEHGPFWAASSRHNLQRSLVRTSYFIPCHFLFLFCIKRYFFFSSSSHP